MLRYKMEQVMLSALQIFQNQRSFAFIPDVQRPRLGVGISHTFTASAAQGNARGLGHRVIDLATLVT
jgi:hypothetical protein